MAGARISVKKLESSSPVKNNQYDKIGPAGRFLSGETSRSNARPLPRSDEKCSSPVTGTSVAKSIPAATYNGAPRPICSAPPFAQASVIQPAENDNMEQSK